MVALGRGGTNIEDGLRTALTPPLPEDALAPFRERVAGIELPAGYSIRRATSACARSTQEPTSMPRRSSAPPDTSTDAPVHIGPKP